MEKLSELSVISWVAVIEGWPLRGVPLYAIQHFLYAVSLAGQPLTKSGGSGHLTQNELWQRNVIITQYIHHSRSRKPVWLVLAQV